MDELEYLRNVCETQDKFIKGSIEKEELEQELEILRLKYIDCLKSQKCSLGASNAIEKQNYFLKNEMIENSKKYATNTVIPAWGNIIC